jgi:hypothetical protein
LTDIILECQPLVGRESMEIRISRDFNLFARSRAPGGNAAKFADDVAVLGLRNLRQIGAEFGKLIKLQDSTNHLEAMAGVLRHFVSRSQTDLQFALRRSPVVKIRVVGKCERIRRKIERSRLRRDR